MDNSKRNMMEFNEFFLNLRPVNNTLDFFTDFKKCSANVDKISLKLHALNFLLAKDDLRAAVKLLFEQNPSCFEVLNILIAVRDDKLYLDKNKEAKFIKNSFKDATLIYEFLLNSGLVSVFRDRRITNLNDYVFGIEVGLDSNARKNRTGKAMEKLIASEFDDSGIVFIEQLSVRALRDFEWGGATTRYLTSSSLARQTT